MNDILDKLGIYDLIAVLLSGMSICVFTIFIMQNVYKVSVFSLLDFDLQLNEELLFIIISYFVGFIFQEAGSFIQREILDKNNTLLHKIIDKTTDVKNNYGDSLSITEKEKICEYVENKLELEAQKDNCNDIYNYCKYAIIKLGEKARIDKEQAISAMSRSFSLYFYLLSIITRVSFIFTQNIAGIIISKLSLFLSILLYERNVRFIKLRYIYIFRYFYYNLVVNGKADDTGRISLVSHKLK